jgi:general secretion pathway protein M
MMARWNKLARREKSALGIAAAVLGVLLLWMLLLAPGLQTLQKAGAKHQVLDDQLQHMLHLQATAIALQSQPKTSRQNLVNSLQSTLAPLGSSVQLQMAGAQLTLTLKQVPAAVLADWLIQSRNTTQMQPTEIRLTRNAAMTAPAWDGTLVYSLPPA